MCVYVCDVKKDTAVIISEYFNFDPLLFYLLYCLDGIFTRVNHFFPLRLEGTHPEMRETVSSRVYTFSCVSVKLENVSSRKREGALSHLHLWIPHSLQHWPWASTGSVTHPHADILLWSVQLLTALQWAANTYPALQDSGLREEFWIWALALLRGGRMLLLPILSNSTVVPGLNPTSLTSLTIQESSQEAPVPSDCPPPLPQLSTWPVPLHPLGLLNISSSGDLPGGACFGSLPYHSLS